MRQWNAGHFEGLNRGTATLLLSLLSGLLAASAPTIAEYTGEALGESPAAAFGADAALGTPMGSGDGWIRILPSLSAPSVKNGGTLSIQAVVKATAGVAKVEARIEPENGPIPNGLAFLQAATGNGLPALLGQPAAMLELRPAPASMGGTSAEGTVGLWQTEWKAEGLSEGYYRVSLTVTDQSGHVHTDHSLRFSDPIAGNNTPGGTNYPADMMRERAALPFTQGEDYLLCAVLDASGGYVYFGTNTSPDRGVAKVALGWNDRIEAARIAMPEAGQVSALHLYSHQAQGNLRLALYDNGTPKTLLWASGAFANTAAESWLSLPISSGTPSTLSIPADDYWLASQTDSPRDVPSYAAGAADAGFQMFHPFGDFPATVSGEESTSYQWSAYLSYGTPPTAPAVSGDASPTANSTPTWTWTPGGGGIGTFRYDLDTSGVWTETTELAYTPALPLGEGTHRLVVQERDEEGVWSASGFFDIVVDTIPPAPPVVAGSTPTNDSTPEWTWTAGGGGNGTFRYELDNSGVWTVTTATAFTPASPLAGGIHRLKVQERDVAGTWSVDSFFDIFVDITPPTVLSSVRNGTSPTNLSAVLFTVTFSEAVTGVNANDFTVTTTGGVTGTSVSTVSGSGTTYSVSVNTGTGNGTLRLDVVDDDSIVDTSGNPLGGTGAGNGGYTAGQIYTIDKTLPLVAVNPLATTDTTPSLTGTVSDPGGGVAGIMVTVGGAAYAATLGSGTWTANVTVPLFVGTYSVVAQATDTAGNVATDATTNELTIQAVGGPGEVWVDFAGTGTESGTQAAPYNTLAEGVIAAAAGGTVKVKGNTARNTSTERLTITKRVRIVSVNGTIRIGVLARSADVALVNADALDRLQMTNLLEALEHTLAGGNSEGEFGIPWAPSLYEAVLPFTQDAGGRQQTRTDSVLAVRLRHPGGVDPDSLWAPVQARGGNPVVSWQPVEEGDLSDLWVIVRPQDQWLLEDLITLTVNGTTLAGTPLEPVTYEFQVVPDDTEPNDAPTPLAQGLDGPVAVGPDSVYAEPQQVWLPVSKGVNAEDLRLFYYHPNGENRGWYPAEQIEGWLVPGSETLTERDGTIYYGFQVRHAGIVQLGITDNR